jgi:hypothetical protein
MRALKAEIHSAHGETYWIVAYQELETAAFRVFAYRSATLVSSYAASLDTAEAMKYAFDLDAVNVLIQQAKHDIDNYEGGMLEMIEFASSGS